MHSLQRRRIPRRAISVLSDKDPFPNACVWLHCLAHDQRQRADRLAELEELAVHVTCRVSRRRTRLPFTPPSLLGHKLATWLPHSPRRRRQVAFRSLHAAELECTSSQLSGGALCTASVLLSMHRTCSPMSIVRAADRSDSTKTVRRDAFTWASTTFVAAATHVSSVNTWPETRWCRFHAC